MDAQEVIERLARMTNSTVESERIFDELFDEWQQQNARIAELEAAFEYVEMEKENYRKRIAEMEKELERNRWHHLENGEYPRRYRDVVVEIHSGDYVIMQKNGEDWASPERYYKDEEIKQWRYVE